MIFAFAGARSVCIEIRIHILSALSYPICPGILARVFGRIEQHAQTVEKCCFEGPVEDGLI